MKICTECEEPISAIRITAKPNATLCRDCQEKKEQNAPAPYVQSGYFSLGKSEGGYKLRRSTESAANGEGSEFFE